MESTVLPTRNSIVRVRTLESYTYTNVTVARYWGFFSDSATVHQVHERSKLMVRSWRLALRYAHPPSTRAHCRRVYVISSVVCRLRSP